MDRKNTIHPHSEEKLSIYREYLMGYLSVLTNRNQQHYTTINIIDLFAGMGVSKNEKEGSAVIAARLINGFREKGDVNGKKNVQFFLNEKSSTNHGKLKENLSEYDFPQITNKPADDFVAQLFEYGCLSPSNIQNSRSLLFVDPHGYTQLSQENLNKLLRQAEVEILLFIPTNSIYRFKGEEGNPARQFVLNFGIQESIIKNISTIDSFAEKLEEKLKEKANTDFVYNYKIKNSSARNSLFHLFFVTKHIKGAEKFLEAKNKIKKKLERQLTFFDEEEPKRENDLQIILSQEKTNKELYAEIIKRGHLSKEINPILKKMENSGVLKIRTNSNLKRRKGAYYLKEDPDKIISMRIKNHE